MNKSHELIEYARKRWQLSKLCTRAGVAPARVYNVKAGRVEALTDAERHALIAVMQLDGKESVKFA